MRTGSATGVRENFFDHLTGPNEKRFVPFNNMPVVHSKYKSTDAPSFEKQVSREQYD